MKSIKSVTRSNTTAKITKATLVGHTSIANQYNKQTGKQGGTVAVANLHQPRGGKGTKCLGGNCM